MTRVSDAQEHERGSFGHPSGPETGRIRRFALRNANNDLPTVAEILASGQLPGIEL